MAIQAQLADGRVLEFPDGTDPEVIQSTVKRLIAPPPPSTERTGGDVVKDIAASAATGIGGLLSFPGQIVQLIPGLQQAGKALETPGEYISKFGEDLKSAGLKAREALRSEALSEAEKDGVLSQFATAITSTIKDPALLTSFFVEQLPLLLGPAGAAKVAQKIGAKGIEAAGVGLTGKAAEEAVTAATQRVGRQALGAAIGTGAAMQAGDISSDTYTAAYQRAIEQGMSPEEANAEALNAARLAGAGAAGISAITGFGLGKVLPSTAAIERRMAGLPGAGRLPSVVGEASSESLEEAGGQIFRNVGIRTIDPTQSLTEGVGAAAGLGALGGGFFGGLLGKKPEAELAPGQLPGETLYQTAERLNKQIADIDEAFKTVETAQKPRYLSSAEIVDLYRTQGYGAVKQYQNTLETERQDESLSKEERKAANEQARDVQDFLNQVTLEEARRTAETFTENILRDREIHLGMGIPRSDPIYKTLLNKDLGKPEDAEAVVNALEGALQRKGLRLTQYERFATALENINQYLSTIPGSGFYAQPSVEPTGREGIGVAGVSGERPAAERVDKVKQPRVVRPTEVVGEPPRGEAAEPAALAPEAAVAAEAPEAAPVAKARKAAPPTPPTPTLPKELAGAKPRYAYGPKQFQLEFASDIDKALFITAQKTPSKRDADYRAWLESQGFTPEQISTQGTAVRQNIKEMAAASDPKQGPLKIAPVSTAKPAEIKERKIKDKIGNTVTEVTLPDGSKHQIIRLDSIEGFGLRGWHDNKNKGPAGSGYLGDTKEEAIKELMRRRKRSLKAEDRTAEVQKVLEGLEKPEAEERAAKVLEEAEKTDKELLTEQRAELIKQLDGILKRILAKYGLKDVKLDLKEAFDSEGSYQRQLITLALNVDSPVRVLRHESIHALKDMGFFTPEQWRVLQKRAKDEWVQNLKDIKHSDTQSRYDAYVEIFDKEAKDKGLAGDEAAKYVEEAVIEEAIADAFGIYEETKAPPGLMNAILNRMNKLFKAIKEAFNIAGIESAEDIFGKIEKGQLKPILKPTEAVVEGEEPAKPSLRSVEIMRGKVKPEIEGKVTVNKVGEYFDDQVAEEFGRQLDYNNEDDFNRAVKLALEEVKYQLKQEKSGLDWYEDDIKRAFTDTIKIIPDLNAEENRQLFSIIAGIMSPQTNARDNWFIAAKAYEHYVETGDVPGVNPETGGLWQGGTTSPNKKVQLEFLDRMIKDMGQEETLRWLLADHTVKEINQFRTKYGNIKSGIDGKATDVKPGLYAFGPKVGPFVANINGIRDVTVDLWMTRTFNRYFGTMIGEDGSINDAPTEPQRRAIKNLVNEVAEDAGLKPYQIQSVLWFYEQSLFSKLGTPAPSYGFSDGATKFVESRRGGGEEGERSAAKEIEPSAKRKPKLSLKTNTSEFKQWFKNSKIVTGRDTGPVSGGAVMNWLGILPLKQSSYWKSLDNSERDRLTEEYRNRDGEPGKPKVMYHGTGRDIKRFRPKQANAIFVSPNPDFAESYSSASVSWMLDNFETLVSPEAVKAAEQDAIDAVKKQYKRNKKHVDFLTEQIKSGTPVGEAADFLLTAREKFLTSGRNIIPLYVSVQKPFDPDNEAHIEELKSVSKYVISEDELRSGSWRYIESPRIQELIKEAGFDGFYVYEGGVKNLAVYSPDQLKSVYNVGAFGQRPVTAEEAERLGMTEEEAQAAQAEGDIRLSLKSQTAWTDKRIDSLLSSYAYTQSDREGDAKAYAARITPRAFLNATADDTAEQRIADETKALDPAELARNDEPIYLEIKKEGEGDYQIVNHEGRHRMMALANAGYDRGVPVVLVNRPYGAVQNAEPIEEAYLRRQSFGTFAGVTRTARKGINVQLMVPISWKYKQELRDQFGGEAEVKFSLRSLVSNAMTPTVTQTVNKIAPPTYNPNLWERILDAVSGDSFTKIRAQIINRYDRLAEYDRAVAKQIKQAGGVQQFADQRAESAALFSDLGAGLLETAMGANDKFGGVPVFRKGVTVIDNFNRTVKGPILIFKPLADLKDPEVFRLYQVWKSVQRGKRLDVEGRENLIDKPDIQAIEQMERQNRNLIKIFKMVDKDWTTYNDRLVKYMVDTGVISPKMAKEWTQHGDYFPFYRLVDSNDVQGPKMFSSLANVRPPKKLKGGEEPLGDFFENIVRNSQAAIQAGIKNVAAQRATEQALRLQQVVRLPKAQNGANVYRVMENGQEVYYESADPLFVDAIKSLNMPDLPFIGLLSGPANILRNLVTKDPAFMLANMMRDSMAAWVTSGVKMTPIIDTARNFGLAIANKSPETQKLYAAGVLGGYDYSRGVKTSAEDFRKRLRELSNTKTPTEKLLTPFTSLWGALEKGTQASDAATRAEVYKRVLAETGNEAEAYWQALEIMNFNRRGRSPVIRVLTAAIPFLNARMQGLDLLFRTAIYPMGGGSTDQAIQRMKTFWVRGMTLMALSGMYWLLTHDDDEYKKQEKEVRDDYWLIPSMGIKIPIPFEIGIMFKVIPERIAELTFGSDTNKDFTQAMKRQFLNTFGVGMPQVAKPLIEVATNHNFFTDRPIIGKGLEDVADPYQVGPSTSRVAEAIGKSVGYSPMKVDHLIKGYTGTMGTYAVDLFDMIFDMSDRPQKASKRFEQMPVIRRFALDPEARGTVTAYYEFKDRVDEIVRTSNLLQRSMNYEEYGKYMQDNLQTLAFKGYVNSLERTMKDYREMKTMVMSSQMDPDQKRDTLTSIGRMESALTRNIQTIKKIAE